MYLLFKQLLNELKDFLEGPVTEKNGEMATRLIKTLKSAVRLLSIIQHGLTHTQRLQVINECSNPLLCGHLHRNLWKITWNTLLHKHL